MFMTLEARLDNLLIEESHIFERDIDSIIDIYNTEYFIEGFVRSVKEFSEKILRVIFTFLKTLQEYIFLSYKRRDFTRLYNKIGSTLEKYPNLAGYTVLRPDLLDGIELQNAISCLKRIELYEEDHRMYEMVTKYEKYIYRDLHLTFPEKTIQQMYDLSKLEIKVFDKKMEEMKKDLLDFGRLVERSKNPKYDPIESLKNFVKMIKEIAQYRYRRLVIMMETVQNNVYDRVNHEVYKVKNGYVESGSPTPPIQKDMEEDYGKFEYRYTIPVGKMQVRVYESNDDRVTCAMIIGGHSIIVDKGFFDQPTGIQEAIILHELGHYDYQMDIKHLNDDDISKVIKRNEKKFQKLVEKYPFLRKYTDIYETQLFYMINEHYADKYAKQHLGKKIVNDALNTRLDKHLEKLDISDAEKEYNREHMKTRLSMS